ncbi:pilus assembly protein TadG-related protein [Nocardioides gansuensis]|nr:pilus assembly protein TadG-related protein [Nocardioides gansuensis]
MRIPRPARDERGATAVLVAALAMALFGAGALAIDVGQVYAKRASLQSTVDMAVMAAAAELNTSGACNVEVVNKAEEFLTKATNKTPDQYPTPNLGGGPGDTDGFIQCVNWHVKLWAPRSHHDFGFAKAVSNVEELEVPAFAEAAVKSPSRSSSLPMYAVSGCDTGHRTISDPPPGPPASHSPPTLAPAGTAEVKGITISPPDAPTGSVAPYPATVSFQVKSMPTGATGQVTFTHPDTGAIHEAGTATALPTGPGWSSTTISISTVPADVLNTSAIWWVRIKVVTSAGTDYSPTDEAEPFVVGDLMFCDGVVSGNFGTLKVARTNGTPATWLQDNIIHGFEPLLVENASSAVPCSPADSEHAPVSPTDCISTDPGFPNEAATDGLVNGSGSTPGRLDVDTTPGCDRAGGSNRTATAPALNDDVLTCYILGGHSVGDVVAGTPNILSGDIFKSPRFFQIPIIPVQASSGASGEYPIVDFRPGFITEEPDSATAAARGAVTGHNGVHFHAGHVEQLNVVLFPEAALPTTAPPVGGEIEYTGSGTKVIVLVN